MKFTQRTRLSCLAALLLAAGFTPHVRAFTYKEGDLLLVFRKATFNDVEFNLGSVSNYLNQPAGTLLTVTNFRLAAVNAAYNNNLSGVNVALVAVTSAADASRRAWVTDTDASSPRQDIAGSKFNLIRSKVEGVGQAAVNYTVGSPTNEFVINPSDAASYTYLASNGGATPDQIPSLSGAVPFTIDNTIPSTLRFFELKVSTATPKPDAVQVGNFSMALNGVLTFSVGAAVSGPSITAQPTNVTVFAGGPVSFNVSANGAPLTYQWYFNNSVIGGATASSYSLTAHPVNVGNYQVIISNAGGSATSAVATLTVNLPGAASLGAASKAPGGPFALQLTGTAGAYYEIQTSTNLSATNWTTIAFITNSGGMTAYSDSSATNAAQKFYRALAR